MDNVQQMGNFDPETGRESETGIPVVRCDNNLVKYYGKGLAIKYSGRTGNLIIQFANALVTCLEDPQRASWRRCRIINPYTCPLFKQSTVEKYTVDTLRDAAVVDLQTITGFEQTAVAANKFIKYKNVLFNDIPVREGVFMHVRLGDALRLKHWVLPADYYIHALSKLPVQTGYVSSDTPDHPIVEEILSSCPGIQLYQENYMDTLQFGSSFRYKVLGLGTYSWMIGFLGSSDKVMCPTMQHMFRKDRFGNFHQRLDQTKNLNVETNFPRGRSHCGKDLYVPKLGWYYV